MKNHKRKTITFDFNDIEGDLDNFNTWVSNIRAAILHNDMKKVAFELDGYGDGYWGIDLIGWVPMTEAEKKRAAAKSKKDREAKAAKEAARKEERRKQFEELKKEFEGN